MWILMTKEIADSVRRAYGMFYALNPVELANGLYVLPVDILDKPEFLEAHGILAPCQVIDNPVFI